TRSDPYRQAEDAPEVGPRQLREVEPTEACAQLLRENPSDEGRYNDVAATPSRAGPLARASRQERNARLPERPNRMSAFTGWNIPTHLWWKPSVARIACTNASTARTTYGTTFRRSGRCQAIRVVIRIKAEPKSERMKPKPRCASRLLASSIVAPSF